MKLYTLLFTAFEKLGLIKDFVIEEGYAPRNDTSHFYYRKWSSGKLESWALLKLWQNATYTEGSVYYSNHSEGFPLKIKYIETPIVVAKLRANWIGDIVINHSTTNQIIDFYCWTARDIPRVDFYAYFYTYGFWKK